MPEPVEKSGEAAEAAAKGQQPTPKEDQPKAGEVSSEQRGRQAKKTKNEKPVATGQPKTLTAASEKTVDKSAEQKTAEQKKAEEPKPATSPAPPPPIESRDEDPFHRNIVNTEVDQDKVPIEPSVNLEREAHRSRNEDINDLVEQVRAGVWEAEQRERIQRERYGRPSVIRDIKAWLSGENDMVYNPTTGTVEYRYGTETLRRLAHLSINTAETAGLMAIIGLVTGGAGVVVAPALIGSTLGRGFAEAWQGVAGKERGMREDMVIARERYYQKARELADRIPPTEPANWDQMTAEQRSGYITERNTAVRSLVDFVHASEQNGVDLVHRGRERESIADIWRRRNEPGGQPFVGSEVFGQPVEVGDRSKGEPVGPTGPAGPSISRGAEVYQPSPEAPTAENLDDMEKEFQKFRRRWDLIKAGCTLIGGLAGSASAILEAKKEAVNQLTQRLEAGQNVKLDIDGNWIWHNVQKVSQGFRNAWGIQDLFVFHYNNTIESLKAAAQGSQILPGASQFGSHLLNETALRIAQAIDKQAWLQALRYTGLPAIGAIAAHFVWRKGTTEAAFKHHEKERDEMKQEEEILRRRRQPENRMEQLKSEAHKLRKVFPEKDQTWRYIIDMGDESGKAVWGYIEILEVIDVKDQVFIRFLRKDPRDPDITVEEISAEELIYGGYECVRTKLNVFEAQRANVTTPQPGQKPSTRPSGPTPGVYGVESTVRPGGELIIEEEEAGKGEVAEVKDEEATKTPEEEGFLELKVGDIVDAELTKNFSNKNHVKARINGKNCQLIFDYDIITNRFRSGDTIDIIVRQVRGDNITVSLGPKAKEREENKGYDEKALDQFSTNQAKQPELVKRFEGAMSAGSIWKFDKKLIKELIHPEEFGFTVTVLSGKERDEYFKPREGIKYKLSGVPYKNPSADDQIYVNFEFSSGGSSFIYAAEFSDFIRVMSPGFIADSQNAEFSQRFSSWVSEFSKKVVEEGERDIKKPLSGADNYKIVPIEPPIQSPVPPAEPPKLREAVERPVSPPKPPKPRFNNGLRNGERLNPEELKDGDEIFVVEIVGSYYGENGRLENIPPKWRGQRFIFRDFADGRATLEREDGSEVEVNEGTLRSAFVKREGTKILKGIGEKSLTEKKQKEEKIENKSVLDRYRLQYEGEKSIEIAPGQFWRLIRPDGKTLETKIFGIELGTLPNTLKIQFRDGDSQTATVPEWKMIFENAEILRGEK